jgi:hypothetical protein
MKHAVYSVNRFHTIEEVGVVRVVNKAHKTIDWDVTQSLTHSHPSY